MKLVKSTLLGAAAGLAAVSYASAADLGVKKPTPVEYVRVCSAQGAGFFFIPGTETCLKVGGRVRFQYGYVEPTNRNSSRTGFRGEGRINLDARTQSDYGVVRAFVQIDAAYRTGSQRSGTAFRFGQVEEDSTGFLGGRAQTNIDINQAFIQFAGFTVGKTGSFFDPLGTHEIIGTSFFSSPGTLNLAAYSFAPGNGLIATISVEDPVFRRNPITTSVGVSGNYAGVRLPDFVGDIRFEQAWGIVKFSGVVHEVATNNLGVLTTTEYGYAFAASAKINTPFIAPGDNLFLNFTYGEGALNYVASNNFGGATVGGVGAVGITGSTPDGIFNAAGRLTLPTAYAFAASFQHFWTPTISSAVFGSYIDVDFEQSVNALPIATTTTAPTLGRDYTAWSVGVNTVWQPVRGLTIGGEIAYFNIDPSGRVLDENRGAPFTKSSADQWLGRLRIARDF